MVTPRHEQDLAQSSLSTTQTVLEASYNHHLGCKTVAITIIGFALECFRDQKRKNKASALANLVHDQARLQLP
jgi:hypothetical protein